MAQTIDGHYVYAYRGPSGHRVLSETVKIASSYLDSVTCSAPYPPRSLPAGPYARAKADCLNNSLRGMEVRF